MEQPQLTTKTVYVKYTYTDAELLVLSRKMAQAVLYSLFVALVGLLIIGEILDSVM